VSLAALTTSQQEEKDGGAFWREPDRQALHRRGSWLAGTISRNLLSQRNAVIFNHTSFPVTVHSEWRGTNKIVVKSNWRSATRVWLTKGILIGPAFWAPNRRTFGARETDRVSVLISLIHTTHGDDSPRRQLSARKAIRLVENRELNQTHMQQGARGWTNG